ncbi:MAG TPA: tyrosine-type recombinase/integrase, partial [Xanthobacteraceae bacterium]|nr:tyrosine-type recombinase/integrase [Xanthobacteraceae bacterium]
MKPPSKLTKTTVAALTLPRRKRELLVFDDDLPGFGVRLREGGSKTWIFQYKLGSKHRRISLGHVSALDPAAAREQASKLHAQVRLGLDPAGLRAESRARADETFGACIRLFLAWQRGRVKSFRDVERHLVRNLAALHNLPLAKIDQRTIAAQLTRISARGSPVQANRTRASLSKFFSWACGEGLAENNPAALCNRNPEKSRDRVLSRNELKQIWAALPESDYGAIVKLLVLTGQRATEISDLQWSEIDGERGVISLPPSRTKNRRRHVVPMSDMVRAILEARPRNGRDHVFGVGQKRGFTGWSRAKNALDEVVKIPSWRVHDIRRSTATGMAEIGIQPWIIESILNHV